MSVVNIILGPTSSGKTSLAIKLCKKYGGDIISADSRQIYKKMNIGTGKVPITSDISVENMQNYWLLDDVVVWGYDLADPNDYFSAYDYAKWALEKTHELLEQGKDVFLVGGTGFYIDLFTGNKKPSRIPPNFELRAELESLTLEQLQKELMSLNLQRYNSIDQNNPARLMRAIEIEKAGELTTPPLPYLENTEFNFIGLTASRDFLYARTDKWLETIWINGLKEETKNLLESGYQDSRMLNGLIYKSAVECLAGKDAEMAMQEAIFNLHAYIRRQQTYFKKMPNVSWIDITQDDLLSQVEDKILNENN